MPRVVGIDHLVLSVGDFARSGEFYDKLLGFLGFKRKYDYQDMVGWSNGKTLFWIAAADARGRQRKYRKGDIGFHHYAFELASRVRATRRPAPVHTLSPGIRPPAHWTPHKLRQ